MTTILENRAFVSKFTPAQFNQIEKELSAYFKTFGGVYTDSSREGKHLAIKNYEELDAILGLAYTSTGDYAGLWICNGVNLNATTTHRFVGFAFDCSGNLFGVAWDESENEIHVNISERLQKYEKMTELQKSLSRCRVEGNVLYLPSMSEGKLSNYNEVRTALLNAGAAYKHNTFVFPNDAKPYIDRLMGGESVNIKKEFQFFATPDKLADRLVELAELVPFEAILEPSAGQGAIVKAIFRAQPKRKQVDCCELMDVNESVLKQIDGAFVIANDFLQLQKEHWQNHYYKVIANPPFNKNQDIDHIRKMYEVCKVGGRIVTIASNSWRTGSQKKQVTFREWLDEVGAEIQEIERGEFQQSGTMVSACIVIINK